MADKTIGSLPAAPDLYDDSLLAVEQQGQAVKLTGAQIKGFARQGVSQYVQAAQDAASEALEAVGKVGDSVAQAQTAAQTAQEYSGKPPVIQDGTWWTWNAEAKAYQDTGKPAQGPQGEQGIQGIQGPEGKQGPIGPQGQPGADGTSFVVKGRFDTLAELESAHPAGQTGDAYAVGTPEDNTVYLWSADAQAWQDVGSLQGPEGPEGKQGPVGPQGPPGSTEAADAAAQAAQTAAEQAAAAAAAKQDKLTGTAGQVVGFNAEGEAVARSAVLSFNGRTGAVTPKRGDYTVTQVTGAAPKESPVFTGAISLGRKSGTANGTRSIAAGYNTEASGNFGSIAFGEETAAIGRATAALGRGSIATGELSHAEGLWTIADSRAHAEGDGTIAASYLSFLSITDFDYDQRKLVFDSTHRYFDKAFPRLTVGGKIIITFSTWATGPSIYTVKGIEHSTNSITIEEEIPSGKSPSSVVIARVANEGVANHTEGSSTIAIGGNAHAEGYRTLASGWRSHAEGWETVASGYESHAAGCGTVAGYYATTAIGRYNNLDGGETPNVNKNLFIVGNGQSASSRSNAFRVDVWGSCYGVKAWNSSGADYAELFEWLDSNPAAEDRVGLFVTLEGDRLRLAGPEDDFILGIVSADPSVVGDVYDDQWAGMYLRDVFGRTIMEMQDFPAETTQVPREDGTMETVELIPARRELAPKLNPDYDHTIKYLPRTQRPEWDAVGMMGKLVAVDDGTCQVNGWCAVGEGGKATHSDARTRYRVMARLDETHIRVLIL